MSQDVEVEIKVNGKKIKAGKAAKERTGLEIQKSERKVYAVFFNEFGAAIEEAFFKSEKEATQQLASPRLVGCTVVIYNRAAVKRQKLQLEDA